MVKLKFLRDVNSILIRSGLKFIQNLCCTVPVKRKKILFINFGGSGFGDNPKYICLETLQQNLDLDRVWAVNNVYLELPKEVRPVKYRTVQYYYELLTAHIIVINTTNPFPKFFKKKSTQIIIQTWHGSHGFKYIERQADEMLPASYVEKSKNTTKMTDVFISDGPDNTQMYRESFHCTCDILETGMPREDILFSRDTSYFFQIKKKIGVELNKSILLYAPTFRVSNDKEIYNINFSSIIKSLKKRFNNDWIVLVRFHPNERDIPVYSDDIINVSRYGDIQELIAVSDALITDYSSIYHDFFLMNKPVFLYTKDLDRYIQTNRHLKPMFFDMPWNRNETEQDLNQEILHFDGVKYKNMVNEYKKRLGLIADGKASYRVVDYIKKHL